MASSKIEMENSPQGETRDSPKKKRFWGKIALAAGVAVVVLAVLYVKLHPLVFNESLWSHAHCMPQTASLFYVYADKHEGAFPYHTNGYGNALLMLAPDRTFFDLLTGPGFDASVFEEALASKGHVDERRCGRVYVQGLSRTNDPRIALLFDKVAAPPDHCHFPYRLWSRFVHEALLVGGDWRQVPVAEWPQFVHDQIELLVQAGFTRKHARELYDQAK